MSVRGDRVWLGGTGGVELFTKGHFYVMRWKDQDLPGRVSGVLETETGDLWMNGFSGITHVSAGELAKWLRDPAYAVSGEHLDALDGLPGLSAERIPEPSLAESQRRPAVVCHHPRHRLARPGGAAQKSQPLAAPGDDLFRNFQRKSLPGFERPHACLRTPTDLKLTTLPSAWPFPSG